MKIHSILFCVISAAAMTGCAETPAPVYQQPSRLFALENGKPQESLSVYDPVEAVNRRTYKFNAKFDKYVFLPVVNAYDTVVPDYANARISSFFANLGEFSNATNSALQAKPKEFGTSVGRFAINTTVGLLGFYDPATTFGLKRHKEDFGKTLGYWGVGPGAYLVLPVLGPSNVRDTMGLVADSLAFSWAVPNDIENNDPYKIVEYGVYPVNTRANNSFRYNGTGSPFEYDLVRYITDESRRISIEK